MGNRIRERYKTITLGLGAYPRLPRSVLGYTPPRPLAEIEGELKQIEQEIAGMLGEVTYVEDRRKVPEPAGVSPIHDRRLAEIVCRLVEAYQPERIYLFGSSARGEAGPDSDYDLVVVVSDDAPSDRRRSRLAYQVLRGTGTAADVLVLSHSYFEARRYLKASLPATVLREGRLLHAT